MKKRIATLAAAIGLAAVSSVSAQVLVDENFDSYSSTFELNQVWTPDGGDGQTPTGGAGELIPTTNTVEYGAAANPTGIQGNGVGNFGGVNEYNGSAIAVTPSATQNIVVRGDIYVFDDGTVVTEDPPPIPKVLGDPINNTRQTIGIRNDTLDRDPTFGDQFGLNIIEMGFWNDSTCDPSVAGCDTASGLSRAEREANPGFRDLSQFGYRIVLFGSYGEFTENGVDKGPLQAAAPNWQYFQLDPALDDVTSVKPNGTAGDGNGMVNILDIGEGWHTFEAEITEGSVSLSLDLFRDGINNATGEAGVDSSMSVELNSFGTGLAGEEAPFTSLRIGGPSGRPSIGVGSDFSNYPGVFDNLYLALEDVDTGGDQPGDFNADGRVDNGDLNLLLGNWGNAAVPPEWVNGFESPVDNGELNALLGNWGFGVSAAVPEPTSLAMLALATGVAVIRRR